MPSGYNLQEQELLSMKISIKLWVPAIHSSPAEKAGASIPVWATSAEAVLLSFS